MQSMSRFKDTRPHFFISFNLKLGLTLYVLRDSPATISFGLCLNLLVSSQCWEAIENPLIFCGLPLLYRTNTIFIPRLFFEFHLGWRKPEREKSKRGPYSSWTRAMPWPYDESSTPMGVKVLRQVTVPRESSLEGYTNFLTGSREAIHDHLS